MPFLQGEDNLDSREIHQKKPPAEATWLLLLWHYMAHICFPTPQAVSIQGFQTGIQVPINTPPSLAQKLASTAPNWQKGELRYSIQVTVNTTPKFSTTSENTHQALTSHILATCHKHAPHHRIPFFLRAIYLTLNFSVTSIKLRSLPPNQQDLLRCFPRTRSTLWLDTFPLGPTDVM